MAVGCTRSNLCTSLIKSPVSSSHVSPRYCFFLQNWSKIFCEKFTLTLTDLRMTQKAFISNYGHSGWKKNCHSVAFNNVFFLRPVRFLLSWKKLFLTTSHWELDVLTLWNDAVILELLLQQSVFLLQCLNLT